MPIILNGTTFNNGGERWSNNTRLKEIWCNGVLVWKAENVLYPASGVTVQNHVASSVGTFSLADFKTSTWSGTNYNSTLLYAIIDLTDVANITIRGEFSVINRVGYSGVFLASPSQWSAYYNEVMRYPYYTIGPGYNAGYVTRMTRVNNTTGTINTVNFDVSNLSGQYYICIGCYFNTSADGTATAQITEIVGQ